MPSTQESVNVHAASEFKMLSDELRYKILKRLESDPNLTQRELAKEFDMSLGKVNYCLKALLDKGWIKAGNFKSNPNKMGYAYILTQSGIEEKANATVRFVARQLSWPVQRQLTWPVALNL